MLQDMKRRMLLHYLLHERGSSYPVPEDEEAQKYLLRGLMNIREPGPIDAKILAVQDACLQEELLRRTVTDAARLPEMQPGISVWKGDITTLKCDAIVNAANSGLTGCYIPNHNCIDNCIHTYAGMQLRQECAEIVRKQGHPEPIGLAKITGGYNLPARHVLHTVGPAVSGRLTLDDCGKLQSCYQSCLALAAENNLKSLAFCCISTGVFRFPVEPASQIAVVTVKKFLKKEQSSLEQVIFTVFSEKNRILYEGLLA